jgi:arylsulfatase A
MDPRLPASKSAFYNTPEIEMFALEAMTFSQAYAPAPKCSPSRSSILTGRSTARNSFTNTDNNINTGK